MERAKIMARQADSMARVEFVAEMVLRGGSGFCPSCGVVSHDEDGCCNLCGALATGDGIATLMADIDNAIG